MISCAAKVLLFAAAVPKVSISEHAGPLLVLMGWHLSISKLNSNSKFPTRRLWCSFWQVTCPSLESIRDIIKSIVGLCYNLSYIAYYMCDYCKMIAKMLNCCEHVVCLPN